MTLSLNNHAFPTDQLLQMLNRAATGLLILATACEYIEVASLAEAAGFTAKEAQTTAFMLRNTMRRLDPDYEEHMKRYRTAGWRYENDSTFFQVMEAMSIDDSHGDGWEVEDSWAWDKEKQEWRPETRVTRVKDCQWWTARVWGDDKSLEDRHAHAVCACAWKAMSDD